MAAQLRVIPIHFSQSWMIRTPDLTKVLLKSPGKTGSARLCGCDGSLAPFSVYSPVRFSTNAKGAVTVLHYTGGLFSEHARLTHDRLPMIDCLFFNLLPPTLLMINQTHLLEEAQKRISLQKTLKTIKASWSTHTDSLFTDWHTNMQVNQ